jgi:hypothetical protein
MGSKKRKSPSRGVKTLQNADIEDVRKIDAVFQAFRIFKSPMVDHLYPEGHAELQQHLYELDPDDFYESLN